MGMKAPVSRQSNCLICRAPAFVRELSSYPHLPTPFKRTRDIACPIIRRCAGHKWRWRLSCVLLVQAVMQQRSNDGLIRTWTTSGHKQSMDSFYSPFVNGSPASCCATIMNGELTQGLAPQSFVPGFPIVLPHIVLPSIFSRVEGIWQNDDGRNDKDGELFGISPPSLFLVRQSLPIVGRSPGQGPQIRTSPLSRLSKRFVLSLSLPLPPSSRSISESAPEVAL